MMEYIKQRVYEVERLLHNCLNEKLCYGRTVQAREYAEQAYRLAREPDDLNSYLPRLAAYRLAHLILRSDTPSEDELHDADKMLLYASQGDAALGPMPSLFRVALLIRMKMIYPENVTIDPMIKIAFDRACETVKALGDREPSEKMRRVALQGVWLNLLEMTAYSAGLPYGKLEGLKDPWGDLHLSPSSWFLVGKIRPSQYRYPREYAFAELDLLGETHPEAILFRLCEHPQWKRADSSEWKNVRKPSLRLIAGALAGERLEELRRHVVGGDDIPNAFKTARSRARDDLREMLGRKKYEPLPDSPDGGVKVADDLLVFGAVYQKTFREVP